ncbi:MAG: hypothetical protein IPI49_32440 [Myxococcales bacterium]|nr:hypothetical protein [Myxococcales bacterium]
MCAAALALAIITQRGLAQSPAADPDAQARAAFLTVHRVLTSPRCRNCHPRGDRPLQFDDGVPHAQDISRRSVQNGMPCSTCHRDRNGELPGQPPGAPHWGLPPASAPMVFEGKSPRELCEQLKDKQATGGRDLPALLEHIEKDPLVLWGFRPGPGRTPVPVPFAQFTAATRTWVARGGPCPE